MKPFAQIIVLHGVAVRFNGEIERTLLGAYIHYEDAKKAGEEWCKEKAEYFENEGLNWVAQFETKTTNLY